MKDNMKTTISKEKIIELISEFVCECGRREDISTQWREPLVGFADAGGEGFRKLKEIVGPQHVMPEEVIDDPTVVISYYVPFTKEISQENTQGRMATKKWALTYEETNAMFMKLNEYLADEIRKAGYNAGTSEAAYAFDEEKIISRWSQRHIAYLAGLGTFGLNNMLITAVGCCGRFNSLVTDIPLEPDVHQGSGQFPEQERCLYKSKGTCALCVSKCPSGALTTEGFDRKRCYAMCKENARIHTGLGRSYDVNSEGSDVCGKCVAGMPCAIL